MKIYLIPGLGCDIRVFENLMKELDAEKHQFHCFEHMDPTNVFETIPEYAKRLADQMPKDEKRIIIGMSLGGMIATELAKLVDYEKLIIISSIKHRSERPVILNLGQKLPLHHLAPSWFTKNVVPRFARWLGVTSRESSLKLQAMLKDRTPKHLRWGRNAAVGWENDEMPENYIHIHGTKDHIFGGTHYESITHKIEGGTHNMIMDRADELAKIINEEVIKELKDK